MALKPDLINFFLRNIQNSNMKTFGGEVSQVFEHLESEIKENQVYNKYEEEVTKWERISEKSDLPWRMPNNYEDAKSSIYSLYRRVGQFGWQGYHIPMRLLSNGNEEINDSIASFNKLFLEYFRQVLQEIINANPEIDEGDPQRVKGNTVFIIHGHDEHLKTETQLLLTRAGINNLVLHEQPDKGRTIIDKLVEESSTSNYAIALLSPDDVLEDGSTRARQNVILELGYFIGKLGKERVRLLKKGNIDIPSDMQGVLYEKVDDAGAWKMKICKELMAVGIYVDIEAVASKI
jgi:predicted nucleotide-binding protein